MNRRIHARQTPPLGPRREPEDHYRLDDLDPAKMRIWSHAAAFIAGALVMALAWGLFP